jgi:hypothetical protein
MYEQKAAPPPVRQIINPLVLVILVAADAAFVALHLSNRFLPSRNPLFSLSTDGGYAELFQYLKEGWVAAVLFVVCWRIRQGLYAAWALLFAYLLSDDALTIHERAGQAIATRWGYAPAFGLRAQDFGELTVIAFAGSICVLVTGYLYMRGNETARSVARDLVLLVGLLAFFGVFFDMVHNAIDDQRVRGMIVVEDSGEMIAMSLIVSYVARLLTPERHAPGLLWQSVIAPLTGRNRRSVTPGRTHE